MQTTTIKISSSAKKVCFFSNTPTSRGPVQFPKSSFLGMFECVSWLAIGLSVDVT
jgi:hypothetical protein